MSESNYTCPHCRGTIRVHSSMAGQAVMCPLCRGTLSVPETSAESQPPDVSKPPDRVGDQRQFGCPICNSVFLVTAAMLGGPVQCPSCQTIVSLPPTDGRAGESATSASKAYQESPTEESMPSLGSASESDEPPRVGKSTPAARIDELLPPRFETDLPVLTLADQVVVRTVELSDDDGNSMMRSVTTSSTVSVMINEQEHILRRLSPEEIQQRRRWRNVIMFVAGAIFLALAATVLMRR